MLAHRELDRLEVDGEEIGRRLRARVSTWELFALAVALGLLGFFVWAHSILDLVPNDFHTYLRATTGDFKGFFYAYWVLPFFSLLGRLPPFVAYAFWGTTNILCVFFASRVFGGRTPLVLLSFQMLYVAFVGQIAGVICAGLALLWWGLKRKRWALAGFGLAIACTKFHIGLILGSTLLLMADISWRERLRVVLIPAAVLAVSLVVYPAWPLDILASMRTNPANEWGSIALWRWIGPYALILWIPPLILPLPRSQRLIALAATMALALPYFQQTDLLTLFILPIGWAYVVLGNVGYLFFAVFWDWVWLLSVAVCIFYCWIILPALWRFVTSLRSRP